MKKLLTKMMLLASTLAVSTVLANAEPITITSDNIDAVKAKSLEGCTSNARCAARLEQAYDFLGESLRRYERTSKERNETVQLVNTLTESLNELNKKYEDALAKLSSAGQEKLDLSDQLDDLSAKLADQESELSSLRANLAGKEKELGDLLASLADKESELADLQAKLADKESQLADLQAKLDDSNAERDRLSGALASANEEIGRLKDKLAATSEEIAGLNEELAAARHENTELRNKLAEAEKARQLLANLFGDLTKLTVSDLRPVKITNVNPQDWLINNVYLRYLRNETIENLLPLDGSAIATQGVQDIQLEMNEWMRENNTDLVQLQLPLHRAECGKLLCPDGIVGIRTREVAIVIDAIDPDFWRGSVTNQERKLKQGDKAEQNISMNN